MYGPKMLIKGEKKTIRLIPPDANFVDQLTTGFQSLFVHENTLRIFAAGKKGEIAWLEKAETDPDLVTWMVQPEGEEPVGITSLHKIVNFSGTCSSGIVIYKPEFWGQGIASLAHLGRMMFAADYLNKSTIQSKVREGNAASFKALQKVGYHWYGTDFRRGRYVDSRLMIWFNPERIQILFPGGLLSECSAAVKLAEQALSKAREIIVFE